MTGKANPSGRFVLRLDPALHEGARREAAHRGISLNAFCSQVIQSALTGSAEYDKVFSEVIELSAKEYGSSFVGLVLFGSRARGDASELSDLDLLIVLDSKLALTRSLYRIWDRDLPEQASIHLSHLPSETSKAGSLWFECALDGKVVFDPSRRIKRTLSGLRDYITSGAVTRKVTHGQGYWVYQ